MRKLICGLAKLFALLAVLGALVYAAVLYCMLGSKEPCCCGDDSADYADWES